MDSTMDSTMNSTIDPTMHPTMDPLAEPRSELVALVNQLLPPGRVVGFDTIEGQMMSACIEGLLTGTNEMGESGETRDDAMSRTDVVNPGCIEMMRRESLKLAAEGSDQ